MWEKIVASNSFGRRFTCETDRGGRNEPCAKRIVLPGLLIIKGVGDRGGSCNIPVKGGEDDGGDMDNGGPDVVGASGLEGMRETGCCTRSLG